MCKTENNVEQREVLTMFYCDKCAMNEKYPILADERYKSFGPCEICEKTAPCNDFKGDILKMGPVRIYHTKPDKVLAVKNSCFRATDKDYAVFGFDIRESWGDEEIRFMPVFLKEEFQEKEDAVALIEEKRRKNREESIMYFLFDKKGNMLKLHSAGKLK
jgi:hypothetical protein